MQNLLQNKPLIGEDVSWLRELRQKGHESFSLPDAKTEYWRYTKLHDIRNTDYVMDVPFYKVKPVNVGLEGYILYFLNGSFSPQHSNLPQGVEVMPLIEAVFTVPEAQKYLGKIADAKIHPFAALNQAYLNEGIYIKIEKNIELKKPLILVHHTHNEGESLFYNLHNLIVLEENAKASLLEYYTYSGQIKSRYFGNHVNEIILAKGAGLNHYKFQDEAFYAVHIALSCAEVDEGAAYSHFCFQKGANLGRDETHIRLLAQGAAANIAAAYKMEGWATLDTTTEIEHLAPQTYSNQLIKGVVGGEAKGVFQGKIHIAPGAVKTEGHQLHKALLLSDNAETDCKPELEIYADDVQCSHGAATGELDKEQLFYMLSRGIGEDEARQILVEAFLDDVLEKLPSAEIREWMKSRVK